MERSPHVARPFSISTKLERLLGRSDVQSFAMRIPIARRYAKRDGVEIFEVIQGFVSSQVLMALVEFELFDRLADGPKSVRQLAHEIGVTAERLQVFCRLARLWVFYASERVSLALLARARHCVVFPALPI